LICLTMEEYTEKREDTYVEELTCSNCSFHGKVEIEKGKSREETECPRCGTRNLRKSLRGTMKSELDNLLG